MCSTTEATRLLAVYIYIYIYIYENLLVYIREGPYCFTTGQLLPPRGKYPQKTKQPSMSFQDFRRNFTGFNYSFQPHSQAILLAITVFSLILLLAFLYCYYLFFRRYCCFSSTNFFTSSSRHSTAPAPGLDSAAIKSLPIFRHRSPAATSNVGGDGIVVNLKENECSICLGLFEDEEMIKVLPKCNHAYHSECVDQWLANRSICPLCRASLLC